MMRRTSCMVACGLLQEGHQDVAQNVLHADAPRLGPHLRKDFHEAGSGERDSIVPHVTQGIVSIRLRRIGSIEVDHI